MSLKGPGLILSCCVRNECAGATDTGLKALSSGRGLADHTGANALAEAGSPPCTTQGKEPSESCSGSVLQGGALVCEQECPCASEVQRSSL